MEIETETVSFDVSLYNEREMKDKIRPYVYTYLDEPPIKIISLKDICSSIIILSATYYDTLGRRHESNWVFKLDITNKSLYRIIEDQIREEAINNIYSAEDKELLKEFVKDKGHRNDNEIADIFNEKENNVKKPEIIIPQIVEQEPIVSADIDIETGLIDPKRIPNEYCFPTLESRGVRLVGHSEIFLNIIEMMYSSSAIDGTKGEISDKNLYYDYIIPFSKVKNIYLSDFHNFEYYSRYTQKYEDKNENEYEYEYILFCIYEKLKDCPYYIRYLAPIVVDKDSSMTVQDAVNNYYDSISGRVSSRYQKSIEAFQKKYR